MTLELAPSCAMTNDSTYGDVKRYVIDSTGLAYYLDKDVEFSSHVGRRMAALGIADCSAYLNLLHDVSAGEAEHDALTECLTIGETFFFRHQEVFDMIRDQVLPELIERNRQHKRLRIWSAGCANGAEPYTLSILLRRDFGEQLAGWDVTILGTDINRDSLAQCQRGEFGNWAFRSASHDLQRSCFTQSDQIWTIKDEYRRGVLFQYHNLAQHQFPSLIDGLSAFDLILCRNVMIYFNPAIVPRLVAQLYNCLVDSGWLAVGPTETSVSLFRAFQAINSAGAVLYRKGPQAALPPGWSPLSTTVPVVDSPVAGKAAPRDAAAMLARCATEIAASKRYARAPQRDRPSQRPAYSLPATLADVRAKLNCGDSEAAAEGCRMLLAAERLNPLVHFYHALVAEQQGHLAETEAALRRSIYLDRNGVLAHYHFGLVLQRKGDRQAAERSLQNVLALLHGRDESDVFPDADGLTIGALRQLTKMHLEILNRT